MLPRNHPDRIHIAFDDHRLVTNAGLLLPATLALPGRLGLPELVTSATTHLDLGRAPGRANTGDKMMTLVAVCAGGRRLHRRRRRVAHRRDRRAEALGGTVKAPSTPRLRQEGRLWGPSCAASGGAMSANWTG